MYLAYTSPTTGKRKLANNAKKAAIISDFFQKARPDASNLSHFLNEKVETAKTKKPPSA